MSRRLRIATFNVENLDDTADAKAPSLATRISVLRPQLIRLDADILCLQEVHGQETEGQPRQLLALGTLLENTPYKSFDVVSTKLADGSQVYDVRNLVILSRFPVVKGHQYKHSIVRSPAYRRVTSRPPETEAEDITWERPILHAEIRLSPTRTLHVLNVHLKSKNPTPIPGLTTVQKI